MYGSGIGFAPARVPSPLASMFHARHIDRTRAALQQTELQLATGRRLDRPSMDPRAATLISAIDHRIEDADQREIDLGLAERNHDTIDSLLAEATDLLRDANGIASSMIGATIDAETRARQAVVIDEILAQMFRVANSETGGVHLFGGRRSAVAPFVEGARGFRYVGGSERLGMPTDASGPLDLNLSGADAFGATTSRVTSNEDLRPRLGEDTRLADLVGGRGEGFAPGLMRMTIDDGEPVDIDLRDADTIGDLVDRLDAAIREHEQSQAVDILGADRVRLRDDGRGLHFDVRPGMEIAFSDLAGGTTAADLALAGVTVTEAAPEADLPDAKVTDFTTVASLVPEATALGSFTVRVGERNQVVPVEADWTVQDLRRALENDDAGARLEIVADGRRLALVNATSGADMSVFDAADSDTASTLGLETFARPTRLEDFNGGRGVRILSGATDPITGDPDPEGDLDFRITLRDGSSFDVDLAGAETVGDVIDLVTEAGPDDGFAIGLREGAAGFVLTDTTGGGGEFSIEPLNGSSAARDLGLPLRTDGATLVGEDRAAASVDGVFAHLIALRDALRADDTSGITFAGEGIQADLDRLGRVRGELGQQTRRIDRLVERSRDLRMLDTTMRSRLADLDFAEASVRLTRLQVQLQATLTVTSQANRLSLLDFLG